ncbi:hypothetical protein N0V85_001320 [Neurospora sp. IMI 360204]|nr:hypothetical protein N0V85_001320 [Neurospora sp. IMI 360204]
MSNTDSLVASALYNYTYDDMVFPDQWAFLDQLADPVLPAGSIIPANLDNDTGNGNGGMPAYAAPDFSAYNPDLLSSVEVNDEGSQLAVGVDWDELLRPQPDNNHNNNNNNMIPGALPQTNYFSNNPLSDINASTPGLYEAENPGPLAADFTLLSSQPQPQGVVPVVSAPAPFVSTPVMLQPVVSPVMLSSSPSPAPNQEGQQQQQGQQNQQEKEEKPWDFAGHVLEKTWNLEYREVPLPNAPLLSEQLKELYPEAFAGLRQHQPSPGQQLPAPRQAQQPARVQQPSPPLSSAQPSQSPPPADAPRKRGPGRPKGSRNKKTLENMNLHRVSGSSARVTKSVSSGASITPNTPKSASERPGGQYRKTETERIVLALTKQAEGDAELRLLRQRRQEEHFARILGQPPVNEEEMSDEQWEARLEEEKEVKAKWMQEFLDGRLAADPRLRARIDEEGMMVLFPGFGREGGNTKADYGSDSLVYSG